MSEPPYKPKFNTKYEIIGLLQTESGKMVVDCWQYLRGRPRSRIVLHVENMTAEGMENESVSVDFLKPVPGTIIHDLPPDTSPPGQPVTFDVLLLWLTGTNEKFEGQGNAD
tara:strand:+ start:910 stop:1242 length:333 start_codon:yes stop_codon:yes gene_type:complete